MTARVKNPIQPGDGDPRHGTDGGYTNHRCRCNLCRKARADTQAAGSRRRAQELAAGLVRSVPHGRVSTYSNWGCRCEPCSEAARVADAERHQRAFADFAAGRVIVPHGCRSTYVHWGCRCLPCTEAATEYQRRRRAGAQR